MPNLFEKLLVSSPNGGGLFFIYKGQVFRLDDLDTTGIAVRGKQFLRASQPDLLELFHGPSQSKNDDSPIPDIHDVLITEHAIFAVGTIDNEVLQLDSHLSPIQRWQFSGEKDSLHLNCIAQWNGRIVFSAFGDFTQHREYKGNTIEAGFVQDLSTGERLIEGLSQPHSLVPVGKHLLLASSQTNELREYDANTTLLRSLDLGGYTRGISVDGDILYVGLSCSRNPGEGAITRATVLALDARTWQELGRVELPTREIYTVLTIEDDKVLPSVLASISQGASAKYRHSLSLRDDDVQTLGTEVARLKLMETALNEHLEKRVQQYDEQFAALTERDAVLSNLLRNQPDEACTRLFERATNAENLSECYRTKNLELQQQLEERTKTLSALEEGCARLLTYLRHSAEVVRVKDFQLADLNAVREEDVVENQRLSSHLHEALAQSERQLDTMVQTNAQIQRHHDGQISSLKACLAERDAQLADVNQRLHASNELNNLLLNSRSWRWLKPLRSLRRRLGL